MRIKQRDVGVALKNLPFPDQIGTLILCLCRTDVDAIDAIRGLLVAVAVVSEKLDADDRWECGDAVRALGGAIQDDEP